MTDSGLKTAWADLKAVLDELGIYEEVNEFCGAVMHIALETPSPELEAVSTPARAEA